jgi:hypothetical protein
VSGFGLPIPRPHEQRPFFPAFSPASRILLRRLNSLRRKNRRARRARRARPRGTPRPRPKPRGRALELAGDVGSGVESVGVVTLAEAVDGVNGGVGLVDVVAPVELIGGDDVGDGVGDWGV